MAGKYRTSDRFNQIKAQATRNKSTQQGTAAKQGTGQGTSKGNQYQTSASFNQIKQSVQSGNVNFAVDEAYINQFLTDSYDFLQQTQKDYESLDYNTGRTSAPLNSYTDKSREYRSKADTISAFLNVNRNNIDPDIYDALTSYLDDFTGAQKDYVHAFRNAAETYSKFDSEEAYNTALRAYGYQQTYQGKTYDEIQSILQNMENGEEKDWLSAYGNSSEVMTPDVYQRLISEKQAEISALEEAIYVYRARDNYTDSAAQAQYENDMAALRQAEQELDKLQEGKWYADNSAKYGAIPQNADFAAQSKVAEDKPTLKFGIQLGNNFLGVGDPVYDYINDIDGTREKVEYLADGNASNAALHKYNFMDDLEVAIYNYIYNTEGKKAANEYLEYLTYELNARQQQQLAKDNAEFATKHPFWASAASVPNHLLSGVGLLDVAWQNAVKGIKEGVTGEYSKPINYNTDSMSPNTRSTTIRETVAQNIVDKTGSIQLDSEKLPILSSILNGKSFGDVYQLGMSMADSAVVALLSRWIGNFGTVLLGGAAGTQGMLEAVERGATDEQALSMGILNGVFEWLFEKIPLDNLLSMIKKGETGSFIKSVLRQALTEGGEEFGTSVANTVADIVIMAEKSDWNTLVEQYMVDNPNMSEAEASLQALRDTAVSIGWDFVGGVISGFGFGGAASAVQKVQQNAAALKTYGDSAGDLVGEALELSPDGRFANRMQGRLDDGKTLSGGQLNRLVQQNEKAITQQDVATIEQAAISRLQELGETGDVEAIAAAIAKQAAGKKLTRTEQQAIANSKYGTRLSNELNPENIQSGEYSSGWAQRLDTNRINVEEYSSLVEAAQLPQDVTEAEEGKDIAQRLNAAQRAETAQEQAPAETVRENRTVADRATTEEAVEELEAAITLEEASKGYGAQAQAMIHTYTAGQDVEKYDAAYRIAYDMGRSGVNLSYVKNSEATSYLADIQKELAYEAGVAASNTAAQELDAQNKAAANGKIGRKTGGVVRGDGVTMRDIKTAFHDTRGTAYKSLSTIAKVTGINIVLYKSETDADGNFVGAQGKYYRDRDPGTIYIDINAGLETLKDVGDLEKYTVLRTFSHEFTHFIERWNPIRYNEFRKVVFDTLTERGENVEFLIEQKQSEGLDYEAASREVVAEAMTDILPDANFVQELAENHKTIFQKLLEKLKEFTENLRAYFNSLGSNRSREANALKEQIGDTVKYLDSIVKLFDRVAVQAVENYQKTVAQDEVVAKAATTETVVEETAAEVEEKPVETKKPEAATEPEQSDFEKAFRNATQAERDEDAVQEQSRSYLSDESAPKKYSYEWFTSKSDMVVTDIDDTVKYQTNPDRKTIIEAAVANAKLVGTTNANGNAVIHVLDNGADVIVSKNGIRHSMDRRLNTVAPAALKIGEILQNAIQVNNLNPREDNISDTYVLMGMAKNKKNEPYIVSFVVNRYSNELVDMDVMYSVNAKKEPAGSLSPSVAVQNTGYSTGPVISIAEFLNFVNDTFPDVLPEDVLKHYGYDRRPDGVLGEDALYQQRTSPLTDREVLALAAGEVKVDDMTAAEKDALDIFQKRLVKLEDLQSQRAEQGRLYKEQQFGTKVDRAAAAQTLNRMRTLDEQIQRASAEVLSVEEKTVLKRVLQEARTVVEKHERQQRDEKLRRWRERRNDAAAIKKYRDRLRGDVNELTNWILHPDNKSAVKHIPDALKETVIPFLSSINFMSKRSLAGGDHTQADKAFMEQTRRLANVMENSTDIDEMYSNYTDLPPDFMQNLRNFMDAAQSIVDSNSGDFIINQMTAEELHQLSKVVRTLKKYIMMFNRFHVNAMYQHVSDASENSIDFMGQLNPAKNTGGVSQFLLWQQMRPAYAFERFGEGGQAIYDGLRRGQATLAFNTKKIMEFSEKAYTTAEVKALENEVKTIRLGPEKTVTMRVSQIMSLYELSKRDQALGHILGEGIRVATFKNGKQKISDVGHALTPGELNMILKELTPRQMEVADKLQQFMEKQGGAWGNHVTVARFGEKQFGEEHYFPINSDGRHLSVDANEMPGSAALYALLNMGFTKQTQENAKNRIVVYSIFDVFSNHMASMAQYNAFALPVVDALKWFNYQRKSEPDENGYRAVIGSVREQMDRAFGVPEESRPGSGRRGYAQNFVINIIKAFNGTEAQGTPYDSWFMQRLHKYNRAQVAYNLRVVVQQPLAITRAAMLVDYASILKGLKLNPAAIQQNIREMREYSGIAAWKSLGFYDVNISRGLTSIIKHDDTALDKIAEVGMWGAEKADTLTWAAIWSASKEEVKRKQHISPKDAGFYEAVTKLFEEIIYKTQVVDSVLTKNEFMRDKGFVARAVGSFMSEATTTASMLVDAYDKYHMDLQRGLTRQQAWKKNGKMIVRTAYVYGIGAVILAAVQAVADAFRDDDDYQTFVEKWLEAFGGNVVDEIMPFNKLPIVSEFYELAKELISTWGVDTYGNPPQSVFMQWYDSLVKGVEILHDKIAGEDTNYTWYGGAYKLLQAISGMTGLPMAAATREIVTAWNNIVGAMAPSLKVKTYEPSEMAQIKHAYQDGYLTDEEATAELIGQGLVDTEAEAYWTVQGWEAGDVYSRYDAIHDAVRNGGDFNAAMDELTSHGYTEKDVLSQVKSQIGEWYKTGEITKQQAINMLTKYFDMDSDEITETVNRWSSVVVTGIAYEDIKQEFMDGNITAQRAIEMRMRYGGETKEKATKTVNEWRSEKEPGIAYGDIKDAFMAGDISEADARNMYMTYGGLTEADANEKVAVMAFVKKHPGTDGISYAAIESYAEYSEAYGVPAETFYDAWKFNSNTNADVDASGEAISGSKKAKVMAYINTLNLTSAQKDSLYYAFGWAESRIDEAPWH